jgi:DNA-binding SARP family transcriptional activator
MVRLQIKTLGGVQISLGSEGIKFHRNKSLALLIYLAVTGELTPRETLATLFWPENAQDRAFANLRQAIWEINRLLGDRWLEATRDSVQFIHGENLLLDIVAFRNLTTMVKTHFHPRGVVCEQCLANYQQAAGMITGEFLAGFNLRDCPDFDDWQYFQSAELCREFGAVYTQLVEWCSENGEYDQAIEFAHRWLQADEYDENAHRALMRLYSAKGQRHAAIRQYQSCAELLEQQLNITPEASTTELYKMIQSDSLEIKKADFKEQPVSEPKFPTQLTPFIGRTNEISKLSQLLIDPDIRLLTILAPGGMGKSRLAIEIARKLIPDFEDGVYFVPLAPLDSLEMFLSYLANAISYIRTDRKPLNQQLADFFQGKSMLLVLDNLEHLIGQSQWINDILASSPNLKFLATSRNPLNINAETRFHLSGLSFPEEGTTKDLNSYSAVELFLRSAHRTKPAIIFGKDDWQYIGEICRMVGGMPLAIEMATAWLEMLSLAEIVKEIRKGLSFFETAIRDIPERQHSLYAVFDYSWQTLNEKEREQFSQLTIFRGGFTREAAEKVVGISLRQLVGFVNRSLINRTPEDRFEIHELLRQYGFEKLQANLVSYQHLITRYAEYYGHKLRGWNVDLRSGKQRQAMAKISADFENIRYAWEIAVYFERPDLIEAAFDGLFLYLIQHVRYDDGLALFELAAENISDETREGVRLLAWLTGYLVLLNITQGKKDQAEKKFLEHLDLMHHLQPITSRQEKFTLAFHYYIYGIYEDYQGNITEASELFHQSLKRFEELEEDWWCELIYQVIALTQWDLNTAFENHQAALKIAKKINNHYGMAVAMERLGWFSAYNKGDLQKAKSYLQESSRIFLELDDANSYIRHYNCLEQIANIDGQFKEVLELRQKHLHILEKLGDPFGLFEMYMLLGEAYHHIGDYANAERIGRKGFDYLSVKGSKFYQGWSCWFLSLTLIAQKDYQPAYDLLSQAVEISREISNKHHLVGNLAALIRVEIANGNLVSADGLLQEGLREAMIAGEPFMMLYMLASAALYWAVRGDTQKALEVYAYVHSWQFASNSKWFSDVFLKPLLSLTGTAKIIAKERQSKDALWQMAESLLAVAKQA